MSFLGALVSSERVISGQLIGCCILLLGALELLLLVGQHPQHTNNGPPVQFFCFARDSRLRTIDSFASCCQEIFKLFDGPLLVREFSKINTLSRRHPVIFFDNMNNTLTIQELGGEGGTKEI